MRKFEIENIPGRIRPSKLGKSTTEATGSNGSVKNVSEVQVQMELGDVEGDRTVGESFGEALEAIWPGIDKILYAVEENEDQSGFDLTARSKLPELTLDIWPTDRTKDDSNALVHTSSARCISKPKLKVGEDGDCVLVLKLLIKLDKTALSKVAQHIDADVWVSATPSQVDITEISGEDDGRVVATIGG